MSSDVDLHLHLGTAEDDSIVGDPDVAAGWEAIADGFLKDAEDPLLRKENGVAGEERAVHTDKGGGAQAAFDDAVLNGEVFGLISGIRRTEVVEARGAADIHGTLTGVFEMAFLHRDLTGAAFELDGGAGCEAGLADELAACDERLVTADEVDALPAPAGDDAVADGECIKTAAFNGVVIAGGADVADFEMVERDAFDGAGALAAVINVDAVDALPTDAEMAEREPITTGELKG